MILIHADKIDRPGRREVCGGALVDHPNPKAKARGWTLCRSCGRAGESVDVAGTLMRAHWTGAGRLAGLTLDYLRDAFRSGATVEEVADRLGVTSPSIFKWLKARGYPTPSQLAGQPKHSRWRR